MKIIDCFTFFNELELLNYRLNVLNDYVDYFVLVEATVTHTGKKKPLYFEENKEMFSMFKDKIIHIVVDLPFDESNINIKEKNDQWKNEKHQRNCIDIGIKILNLSADDVIVIADLDEITDPNLLTNIKMKNLNIDVHTLEQDFYYYNLNSQLSAKSGLAKILSYTRYYEFLLKGAKVDDIRFGHFSKIERSGWHLSYFGNPEFIRNKLENFAHQEMNTEEFTDLKHIENKIKDTSDLFNRDGLRIIKIPASINDYLPPQYEVYLKKYILF
jgi:beta-1,4-mannosyl-glycoprotein beta-1,4-N-acetylglucosaminyltransferase